MKRPRVFLLNLSGIGFVVRAKWLHSLIHKASINKSMSGFFDIPIGYRDIELSRYSHLKLE